MTNQTPGLDPAVLAPFDINGWRHKPTHPDDDGAADEHLPPCEFLHWPTDDDVEEVKRSALERIRLFAADPQAPMGPTHSMHLVWVVGANVTVWGALNGAMDVVRVPVCMHGHLPPISLRSGGGEVMRVEYCYDCGVYLPAGAPHHRNPMIDGLL